MKIRMLILMAAGLIVTGAATAQGMKIGIKGGATLYKIDGVSFKDEFQWGYHLGGVAELMWSKTWGIQPEVLFNQ